MMCLLALGSAACATTGAVPRPFPGASTSAPKGATVDKPVARNPPAAPIAPDAPAAPSAPIRPAVPVLGRSVAQFALGFRGVPYRLGGTDPAGFDCSGLVQYVFAQYGIDVPRVVEEQYEVGDRIEPSDIKPGDLIFFNTKRQGDDASHVAIAIGGDGFVHAPNSTGVVRVETLSSTYWGSRYIGARRITSGIVQNSALPAP
jgi:peptidoglycan DL-endopeptidase CwlO